MRGKYPDRQILRTAVPFRGAIAWASCLVIWGRQAPHVSFDSPRWGETGRLTTVRRLSLESDEGYPLHPNHREYRETRDHVLARALILKATGGAR